MANNITYTPEELTGKFIVCFPVLSGKRPALDCVRYASGERSGLPYLYNSVEDAQNDQNFDLDTDEAIPADEFYNRCKAIVEIKSHT